MFGRNKFGKGGMFGKSSSSPSSKKHSTRSWMAAQKMKSEPERRRHETHFDVDDDDDIVTTGAAGVMTDTSPSLPSLQSPNYVELPDEPRPGKITPTTPSSTTTTTNNSSPSPRVGGDSHRSNGKSSGSEGNHTGATATADEEEAIEEAVPIVRTTLPSPEPRPLVERNGYGREHDKVDSSAANGLKAKPYPAQRDVDEDSCLIKCVYFTQQCCECTIV